MKFKNVIPKTAELSVTIFPSSCKVEYHLLFKLFAGF